MAASREPQPLSAALSELIALRGYAHRRGVAQLREAWRSVAGARLAASTQVLGIKRGALEIGVANAPLLSELAAFHREALLDELKTGHPALKIRDLKFRLKGDLSH